MEILVWLAPSGVVLVIAMVWAAWAGRPRREDDRRSAAALERVAMAFVWLHPGGGGPGPPVARDRSTGIAVRPSRSTGPADRESPRRSA